jgi:hypothetical protein
LLIRQYNLVSVAVGWLAQNRNAFCGQYGEAELSIPSLTLLGVVVGFGPLA